MPLPVLPNDALSQVTRRPMTSAAVTTSPFTGSQTVHHWGAQWWEYDIEFWAQTGAAGRAISGLLAGLNGPVGQFILEDPAESLSGAGNPLLNGATTVSAQTLVTDGWTNGFTIPQGTVFSLGTDSAIEMYQITEEVVADGTGNATLPVWPYLRTAWGDNTALNVVTPGVRLRLTSPAPVGIAPNASYRFTVSAREVL